MWAVVKVCSASKRMQWWELGKRLARSSCGRQGKDGRVLTEEVDGETGEEPGLRYKLAWQ